MIIIYSLSSHDHGDESMNMETDDAMTASPARAPPRQRQLV